MTRYKVLVIEDNEQNLYLMRFLLEKNGFVVTDARSGHEGLELADRMPPDLILLDIQLPGMDGYSVALELRKRQWLSTVPIVAVTSYAMAGDREKALAAGATDYVEKPIDPATFVARIRTHLPDGNAPPTLSR
ncbi:MAG TPA: response regulator [Polyangiaceae bacterium]|nr:response regulator [Polyangiaceae bacterium]